MDNLKIRRVRDSIIMILNQSELPAEIKRLILIEALGLATKTADEAVRYELLDEKESMEKESEEKGND